jgi:hypothetical protein
VELIMGRGRDAMIESLAHYRSETRRMERYPVGYMLADRRRRRRGWALAMVWRW